MEKIKVPSSGSGYLELGITQDPTEVTNSANSYRIVVEKREDRFHPVAIEIVVNGVWTPKKIDTFLTLVDTLLVTSKEIFDFDKLTEELSFYVLVLDSVQGNPYEGLKTPMEDIEKIINAPNRKIDEDNFLQNYAVFFLRNFDEMLKADPDYAAKYDAAMRRWSVEVAPHTQEVDVVNRSSTGTTVLYTIPPRVLNNDIFDNNKTEERIEDVIYEVAFISQTNPAGAERYLEEGLTKKLVPVEKEVVRKHNLDAMLTMDNIRERYGIPRFLAKPTAEVSKTATASTDSDEGFGLDEMGQF